jgi:hypothetical protein
MRVLRALGISLLTLAAASAPAGRAIASQHSGERVPAHDAVLEHASGGLAASHLEDGADLGVAVHDVHEDRLHQALHGLLHVLNQLVDDLVVADVHRRDVRLFPSAGVRLHVEAHDDRLRRGCQHHV